MTLSAETESLLSRHAKKLGVPVASFARTVLCEGLAHRDKMERMRRLANDYAAGRSDAKEVLDEVADLQLENLE